jgi:CubicO group peptidase (beta-lactamase class C family)
MQDRFGAGWAAVILLATVRAVAGEPAIERPQPQRLEAAFTAAVKKAGLRPNQPGLIAAVVEAGKPVLVKSVGLANVEKKTPISASTTFELASVSKMMTGYAVLILLESGGLGLDDSVRRHIPEFPDYGPKFQIRLEHLVHHTSGLPDYTELDDPEHAGRSFVTNAEYARSFGSMRRAFQPTFAPGARYEYSNTNYMLLGLVIERVSGRSYGTFLKENIFGPFGMKGAWVNERPRLTPRDPRLGYVNAVGYSRERGRGFVPSWGAYPDREEALLAVGDGGVWCGIEDMIAWDRGLREPKQLTDATWRRALTPTRLRGGERNDYGFGLTLEFDEGGTLTGMSHDGAWGGFGTSFNRDVEADRTIIVLSNRNEFDASDLVEALAAAAGEDEDR